MVNFDTIQRYFCDINACPLYEFDQSCEIGFEKILCSCREHLKVPFQVFVFDLRVLKSVGF